MDRALTDTQKRIEQLKREMEQLEAVSLQLTWPSLNHLGQLT